MIPIAKMELAILIPIAILKMIADRNLDRSFTIADRLGDLFTYISYVNFIKNCVTQQLANEKFKNFFACIFLKLKKD